MAKGWLNPLLFLVCLQPGRLFYLNIPPILSLPQLKVAPLLPGLFPFGNAANFLLQCLGILSS